jgi:hypothetical protein
METCKTCKFHDEAMRVCCNYPMFAIISCESLKENGCGADINLHANDRMHLLHVGPDFGCIHHEEKQ